MKHCWVYYGREQCEECERCGLRRRQRVADVGKNVNPARSRYRITEYWLRGKGWTWVRRREPIPRCNQ